LTRTEFLPNRPIQAKSSWATLLPSTSSVLTAVSSFLCIPSGTSLSQGVEGFFRFRGPLSPLTTGFSLRLHRKYLVFSGISRRFSSPTPPACAFGPSFSPSACSPHLRPATPSLLGASQGLAWRAPSSQVLFPSLFRYARVAFLPLRPTFSFFFGGRSFVSVSMAILLLPLKDA